MGCNYNYSSGGFGMHSLFRLLVIIVGISLVVHFICWLTGLSGLTVMIIALLVVGFWLYVRPQIVRKGRRKFRPRKSTTRRSDFLDLD